MTEDEVRAMLRQAIERTETSLRTWCLVRGVNNSHASEFLARDRRAPSDLLDALGLERTIARKRP